MRDGMKKGINYDMLENVMKMTSFMCVASGGVSSIDDIKNIKGKNYSQMKGVIVGKAIYDKNIDIKDALKILSK
jgi:phosphoribosylformimino-5-aminoimidazole carboxamide ribotide isomerase